MRKLTVAVWSCLLLSVANPQIPRTFDIQGHRGCRGLMPENTIPAFIEALKLGVNTLELDVVVSQDHHLVVSHEAYFSSEFSLDPEGKPIPKAKETQHNLFKMSYAEIKLYDVGSRGNRRFPLQQRSKTYKPLLSEVFSETQKYIREHNLSPVKYNIETKSAPAGDGVYHPVPRIFARMLYDEIIKRRMQSHVLIQSFDIRTLQEFKKYPVQLPLVLLVENRDGVQRNIERLGFRPEVYSPNFQLVDKATVEYCRQNGIRIIPWTVNELSDMERMKTFAIDGIITDYPDRAIKVFKHPD